MFSIGRFADRPLENANEGSKSAAFSLVLHALTAPNGQSPAKWQAKIDEVIALITPGRASWTAEFAEGNLRVTVRFGSLAEMLYDLSQFQSLHGERQCEVGVEIVPCRALLNRTAIGATDGEQLIDALEGRRSQSPIVPVKVILIDADD